VTTLAEREMQQPQCRLSTAIRLASAAHHNQTDKLGAPYILHPIRVMMKVQPDIDTMIAAVLHDTVEDTNVALATIRTLFGDNVADTVDALTKRDGEHYSDFVCRCARNTIARRVKLADIADNTDPARMIRLSRADQARLTDKYQAALRILRA
jgi:(p)ppGpp synthase/HD superfamily hydrolase